MRVNKAFWIWGMFNFESFCYLDLLQKKVQKNLFSPKFNLHITLAGPFKNVDKTFLDSLRIFLKDRKSLTLSTKNYEYKDEFFKSLFIPIKNSTELIKLRDDLYFFHPYNFPENYEPHLSLAYGNHSIKDKEKLLSIIDTPPKYIVMDKVSIVDVNEIRFKWEILESINLS